MADESSRRLTLEELLAFPEPVQRLARLAELRQRPGGKGDRPGKQEDRFPLRVTAIQRSISGRACAQSPLRRWSVLAAKWAKPMA